MLPFLLAIIAMICRDASVEFMTIAEVRGNAALAAALGPATTLSGIAVTVLGAGPVIQHGITLHAVAVLSVILATDVVDGYVFTKLGRRITDGTRRERRRR